MTNIKIGNNEVVHFIGIGGIGMSGLAQIMKVMGFNVQGSDVSHGKNIENCKKIGVRTFIGHNRKNILNATIIVKSNAITKKNIELIEAKRKKLPTYERAEMLANIVSLKKNIIVTGSHGKTTTTSLIAKILSAAKLDPTIINGGVINSIKNNAKFGKGEWAILEADESDGSFLKLPINYSVVTNIDNEHLDFYKNYKNLIQAFTTFINKTPPIGKSIVCLDDKDLKKILKDSKIKNFLTYGFDKKSNYQIINSKHKLGKIYFDLKIKIHGSKVKKVKNIVLNLIGRHNILNSTAAIAVCLNLGIKVNYFVDSDERKQDKLFCGIKTVSLNTFNKLAPTGYLFIAHDYFRRLANFDLKREE